MVAVLKINTAWILDLQLCTTLSVTQSHQANNQLPLAANHPLLCDFFFAPCSTHWAVLPLLLEVVLWFLPPGAVHLMMGQITAVMLGTSARDCDTIPFMALPSLAPCSSPCCSRTSCQKLIKGSISHSHPSSESLTWAIASRFSYPAAQVSEHFRVGALPVELLLLLLFMWTHFQGSAQVDWEHWDKSWDEKL